LFIFAPLGLSGPLIVFAGIGAIVLALIILRLPDDTPRNPARGCVPDYPSIGGAGAVTGPERPEPQQLRWRDPRVLRWHLIGTVGGHGHAVLLGVIGFLVIDRLGLGIEEAQHDIAIVLIGGAVASLLAQWWLIPQLQMSPHQLVGWGSAIGAAGSIATGYAADLYTITLAFAAASLGFGLFRPGFTSGASLAVEPHEQNAVAGMVTSVNGVAFIGGPAVGVALYGLAWSIPFVAVGVLMAVLAGWTLVNRRSSRRGAA